jgi:hypothetical protein
LLEAKAAKSPAANVKSCQQLFAACQNVAPANGANDKQPNIAPTNQTPRMR